MKKKMLISLIALTSGIGFAQTPIAHYPFNGNANDASGNGYDGVVAGATLTTDRFGNPNSAYEFHGGYDTDSINCGYIAEIDSAYEFTVSCWVNQNMLDVTGGIWTFYNQNPNSINDPFLQLRTYSDGNLWAYQTGFGGHDYSTSILAQEWHHIAVVFDAQGATDADAYKMYIDGSLVPLSYQGSGMQFINLPNATSFFSIGSDNHTYYDGESWNGKLDDFYIYDVALTENEVMTLYNMPDPSASLSEEFEANLSVYPNPTVDILHIETDQSIKQVRILNLLGEEVLRAEGSQTVHLNGLPTGSYLVEVESEVGKAIRKISKS